MQLGNRCDAKVAGMFHYGAANRGHNGKAPSKVGTCRSRPAGRFLQLQFDTLLIEHHIFLFYDHVLVVVGKKPVFELAPLAHLIEEVCYPAR